MTLNSSGPISLGGTTTGQSIEIELGGSGTSQISLNCSNVRSLLGVSSGQISMSSAYGKSSNFSFSQTISSNYTNYNLHNSLISAGWNGTQKVNASVTINSGVSVYSTSTGTYAFLISCIPSGSSVTVTNNGRIMGMGGNGGAGGPVGPACPTYGCNFAGSGGSGGPAFYTNASITLYNNGTIGGGGGGGGGSHFTQYTCCGVVISCWACAGGGGGQVNGTGGPGVGGRPNSAGGANGTLCGGGIGGSGLGGCGGSLGNAGSGGYGQYYGGKGGSAGAAIVGRSKITLNATGTILGSQTC